MSKDLLLVIDMQNVYGEGGEWFCPAIKQATDNILSLINAFGKDGNVIFTKYVADTNPQGVWKQYNEKYAHINNDKYANEVIEELKDISNNYPVYSKSKYSSFVIPEVREAVKNADRVVVTGVVADCCVMFTVTDLIDEGVPVVYLTDAVAGITKETEQATEKVFEGLSPLHLKIMKTEEYLREQV